MIIKKLSGLQNYYLNLLMKSKSFFIIFSLSLFFPLIVLLILYFTNNNLLESSYLYAISLLLVCFINIVVIAMQLFANPIIDSSDILLISKSIKRKTLYFTKTIISVLLLLIVFFIQSILSIIFTSIVYLNPLEILAYWLMTLFGQSIVAMLLLPIIFLFNFSFSKVVAISSEISFVIIIAATSFLTHFVLPNSNLNNQLIYNNNYKMAYAQLIGLNQNGHQIDQQLVVKQNLSSSLINANTDYQTNLNNVSIVNNFMLGEWLMAPFQAMYMSVNYDHNFPLIAKGAIEKYKFGLVRFYNSAIESIIDIEKQKINYIPIRVQDTSIFNLNASDLINLLVQDIKKIVNTPADIINFQNDKQVNNFIAKLKNLNIVWDQNFSPIEIRTISTLVGLNGEHPSLYYAFKYKDLLQSKLNGFYTLIANDVSLLISDIYQELFNNPLAYSAILYNVNTQNFIDDQYPDVEVIDDSMFPSQLDLDYFKNVLVTWDTNQPSLLLKDKTRRIIDLANISFLGSNYTITNKQEWSEFIDKNALSLQNLKEIYNLLKNKLPVDQQNNMAIINYSPNFVDLNQYSYVTRIKQQSWIDNAFIYMIFIIIASWVMFAFSYQKYSKLTF